MKPTILIALFMCTLCTAQQKFSVYFEKNKSTLTTPELQQLENWVAQNAQSRIIAIDGFTDQDGTMVYNDSLSAQRVNTVLRFLKGKISIRSDVKTNPLGEKMALSIDMSKDRKVTITYLTELEREKESLLFQEDQLTLTLQIKRASVGSKIRLDNLQFELNSIALMPSSKPILEELLKVLKENPNLKIQIQGHICCQPEDKKDLSTQRAKHIKNYLTYFGIDKERMSYKGFGSSKPIYPLPEKTEKERLQNRRVVIEILSQ